ncbi:uncharacterized protein LOC101892947 [Musca domestica]|uniref:Uncharacterized protein LOC101892947 n=1 Tax=Musca domestica TaxID=7370 RepID=A0A1I8MXU0_MUSDO|nr:uncharacterized protein LOC101892947 [Musca domestica]
MKNIVWISIVINLFLLTTQIIGLENKDIPWFIYRKSIYYIDTKPNYTAKDADSICQDKSMIFQIYTIDIADLMEYVDGIYGHVPSFWTYHNSYYGLRMGSGNEKSCYRINKMNNAVIKTDCDEKMGLLCKRAYTGATLYFVNGTRHDIDECSVARYCNPHSTAYDHVIKLCLVHYFKFDVDNRRNKTMCLDEDFL